MKKRRLTRILRIVLFVLLAVTGFTFLLMGLWNVLMPDIFAVRAISFWQALGLLVLARILFGGFRPYMGANPRWRRRMLERWEQMTPEQREQFKREIGCGMRRFEDRSS